MDNETYSVEPVEDTLSGRHRVYKESDSTQPTHVCGMYPAMQELFCCGIYR